MQVGLTFNFVHGETENTPESSGTGNSELLGKYDVVKTVKTACGVNVFPQKADSRNPLVLFGGLAVVDSEGCLSSIRKHWNTPHTGSDYCTQQPLT